ncbi:aminoglycoside phosphotransferase family protein [Parenemella sanctibonifatiensis]|uniref:aminoglycoside phosphotransferase family protein n=1 Tax=Parenemella sanctibonifatiensis TaxID=2016505 RepID=UPI001E5DBCA4|nr:aminoglycoside phosphotransferase family protein [Parenemella sanctibonifatiensis]
MPIPPAEVPIDAELVRALLDVQHPDLAELPLTAAGEGWDNALFRLGPDLVVRLPRRAQAVALIEHELRWMPTVGAELPVPVPTPVRQGVPGSGYPWPWSICRWVDGTSAVALDARARDGYAAEFGTALAKVHRIAPAGAPPNPFRGVALTDRADRLRQLAASTRSVAQWAIIIEDALAAPAHRGRALWVHGDPHPGNVVVDVSAGSTRLAGLVDWGDLTAGDPASDLACLWLHFTRAGHERAWAGYCDARTPLVDAGSLHRRARGWALMMTAVMLQHEPSDPMWACGIHALERLESE